MTFAYLSGGETLESSELAARLVHMVFEPRERAERILDFRDVSGFSRATVLWFMYNKSVSRTVKKRTPS